MSDIGYLITAVYAFSDIRPLTSDLWNLWRGWGRVNSLGGFQFAGMGLWTEGCQGIR